MRRSCGRCSRAWSADSFRLPASSQLYRRVRRAGITVRSSVDCLIAACAIRHGLTVLHDDRDYPAIARVSELQQRPIRREIMDR